MHTFQQGISAIADAVRGDINDQITFITRELKSMKKDYDSQHEEGDGLAERYAMMQGVRQGYEEARYILEKWSNTQLWKEVV